MNFLNTLLIATIPAITTGFISYILNARQREKSKAELMVIKSARHFLEHKSFTDRSFKTLQKYLGGWDKEEDALRKILVSAGAVRIFREDKNDEEWWYLLSRAAERIKKKELKKQKNKK